MTETAAPPWEPTAWMREAIDRRTAQLEDRGIDRTVCDAVVVPLAGNWTGIAGTREDRTCDRCRVYVPHGLDLWAGTVQMQRVDGTRALLAFGLCSACRNAEVVA